MIRHIVLLKFKSSATPGQIVEAGEALLKMKDGIPEIRQIHFGPNLGPSVAEFSHVVMVTCEDMGAVERYLAHAVHRSTADQYVVPIREARLAVDLET